MVYKVLAQGKFRGTNTSLSAGDVEKITLYTCPTGKTAYLKEFRGTARGVSTYVHWVLYVLKNGGTDLGSISGNADPFATSAAESYVNDAQPILSLGGSTSGIQTVALNLVLNAGDAVKVGIANNTGASLNTTTYGTNCTLSGDES